MTGTPGYTSAEIRELVHEYQMQPHGTKRAWVARQPFSRYQLQRWRKSLYEGDLDRNLIPREHGGMTRTPGEWSAFEKARAQELMEHAAEVARLQARVDQLEQSNEALGKAIGILHQLNVQEPDTAVTSEPQDSFGRKTSS